ncbi:MAG: T9SS type A sorting domain-containing protein [Bacteroidales bacterium]|nr:T9SS type A sorting domain-containing protein [Bacteroidales bacterium]
MLRLLINTAKIFLSVFVFFLPQYLPGQEPKDLVFGNLIQFNDNGFWCWYQDERVIIDAENNKLITGSDASGAGIGGDSRNGQIEGVIFDLDSRSSNRYTFMETSCDDHNAPAFLKLPDGKYLTMYAEHYDRYNSRYRIYDGRDWSREHRFDWMTIPGGTDFTIAYSNLYYLSFEDRIYNFARANRRSPNMIVSENWGESWSYCGLLTLPDENIGYVNGYFKYSGNGTNRIDFICTEHHPRDYNTSIYHGYIKNGHSFTTAGELRDDDITDNYAPNPADFTMVFAANTTLQDKTMTRCWNIDVQKYDDGKIAALIKARVNDNPNNPSNDPDHCYIYCRYSGTVWICTYLGMAGRKMYDSEQDYVGLGALHPNNPNIIYISTPVDPRENIDLGKHEIFKGTTSDHGATWTWDPITQNSSCDNFRPVIPYWKDNKTALLWCRGTYYTAQIFDAAVVGIIENATEVPGLKTYVDATLLNTFFANGSVINTTGPDTGEGAADNQWHERTGIGNSNTIFTSAEVSSENSPLIKTDIFLPEQGTYDVWVNFWADPAADWRIKAGLSKKSLQIFRHRACQQVDPEGYNSPPVFYEQGNIYLYQAYLGRIISPENNTFSVYVDDEAILTGSVSDVAGNTVRTWYDGISYSLLNYDYTAINTPKEADPRFLLIQIYPNPFHLNTTISFYLLEPEFIHLTILNNTGQEVVTLVNSILNKGSHKITWDAGNLPSGIYFCKITAGSYSDCKKFILLR